MAGGNIICGTFKSADKSGSALEAVLEALPLQAHELVKRGRHAHSQAWLVVETILFSEVAPLVRG